MTVGKPERTVHRGHVGGERRGRPGQDLVGYVRIWGLYPNSKRKSLTHFKEGMDNMIQVMFWQDPSGYRVETDWGSARKQEPCEASERCREP